MSNLSGRMTGEDGDPGLPFGMYAEVVEPGRVRIGDPVEPVSSRPSETTVAGP